MCPCACGLQHDIEGQYSSNTNGDDNGGNHNKKQNDDNKNYNNDTDSSHNKRKNSSSTSYLCMYTHIDTPVDRHGVKRRKLIRGSGMH